MARNEAQNNNRQRCKRLTLELSPTRTETWTTYATAHGLTLGRMITTCVERCIAEDSHMQELIDGWKEDTAETATGDGGIL